MDVLVEDEKQRILDIAGSDDRPVLMMNLNRYRAGAYPNSAEYREWRNVNAQMVANVDGKILWTLPVQGQILVNGHREPLDEILAYWYPSHRNFLEMTRFEITKRNFELRQSLIDFAAVHRCEGAELPFGPGPS